MTPKRTPVPGSPEALMLGRQESLMPLSERSERSQKAKARQQIGEQAEAVVRTAHLACVYAKLATQLRHGDSGLRPVGKPDSKGRLPCVPKGTGDVDFRASLRLSGGTARPICLEVKHIDSDPPRWPFANIEDHQAAILSEEHEAGSLALLMLVGPRGELWTVPWYVVAPLRDAWKRGVEGAQASLMADDLAPWRVGRELYLKRFVGGGS